MDMILPFSAVRAADVARVGGKNASLGELVANLGAAGVRVPDGFAITADAYRHFLRANRLEGRIAAMLQGLDPADLDRLEEVGGTIRQWILDAELPADLAEEIRDAYRARESDYGANYAVAVRSSATAEDLPDASFAGQQETFLNVRSTRGVLTAVKRVFASLYTNRAISYRAHQGYANQEVAISVGVQQMVRSDRGCSGVMFTLDTETGFRDVVLINGAWGLGETVVQGTVNPDEWRVYKPALRASKRAILMRRLGEKAVKMVFERDPAAARLVRIAETTPEERTGFCLDDAEVAELAAYGLAIEEHYSRLRGAPVPMDIEWAKDGVDGRLYILQARPETVHARETGHALETWHLQARGPLLIEGRSVGRKIAAGRARVIIDSADMHRLEDGEVLVTDITDPDWEPVMKRASAIITNRGGRTCHAAIVARELGIPAIVGTLDATTRIPDRAEVTVCCAEGETGNVYSGILPYVVERAEAGEGAVNTRLLLNVGDPQQALALSQMPADGVGLARLEFIVNTWIKVHPRALLETEKLDTATRAEVARLTAGYASPRDYFVQRLAEGVSTICAAFAPRPVVVRLSDFKSNEYAALVGGAGFEPHEENPMLGFRGASRYAAPDFAEAFALECAALRIVREDMGLGNLVPMVPFVRTVEEGRQVLARMEAHGLRRGEAGLKVYLMCEIPSNALLADQFLDHFDGMSIGSNDLTQLTLGVDRDSGLISGCDERNPAVLALMEAAIAACKRRGKYIGICGQAPSDFPEITEWLVRRGIDSISLNPDALLTMRAIVAQAESAAAARAA
jgi:pyruvate,water dikinase